MIFVGLLKNMDSSVAFFLTINMSTVCLTFMNCISFLLQVGDPKDVVRKMIRNLFKLITKVYPASKMFVCVSEGVTSKNSKTRTGEVL